MPEISHQMFNDVRNSLYVTRYEGFGSNCKIGKYLIIYLTFVYLSIII